MADITLDEFIGQAFEQRGLDLRGYKHSSLTRRLRRRMSQLGLNELSRYLEYLRDDPAEVNTLLNTILINVTEFFRDPQAWDFLRHDVLKDYLHRLQPGDSFRCWSAGCSNGEEPYSLAMLIAETLGVRAREIDVRIYGTDIDEESLALARRGEYPVDQLRRVSAEWRARYFREAGGTARVSRDIRRMVIFGRSNLLTSAPISHCNLIVCRNVMIYLDAEAQAHILRKLHFALQPNGLLFLGKAEPKMMGSHNFASLHPRWRIFQKQGQNVPDHKRTEESSWMSRPDESGQPTTSTEDGTVQQENQHLKLHQRYILETLKAGVLVLDSQDVVTDCNDAVMSIWGMPAKKLTGRRIQSTELVQMCPDIGRFLEAMRAKSDSAQFQCRVSAPPDERVVLVTLRPIVSEKGARIGALLHAEDVTYQQRLQATVRQLQTTSEELQSANEELETTNEELQSTNEELETTNEELQSTNEELETTNEELQSVNEELANMNEELEARTGELNVLTSRYVETLRQMPWPVMVVDADERIDIWNAAALRMLGMSENSMSGVRLEQLPTLPETVKRMLQSSRWAVANRQTRVMRGQTFAPGGVMQTYDIQFTPILHGGSKAEGVLIMFGPLELPAGHEAAETERSGTSTSN